MDDKDRKFEQNLAKALGVTYRFFADPITEKTRRLKDWDYRQELLSSFSNKLLVGLIVAIPICTYLDVSRIIERRERAIEKQIRDYMQKYSNTNSLENLTR